MKLIIDLDIRKNDIAFSIFLMSSFCLFIYSTAMIDSNNLYILNFLMVGVIFTIYVSESSDTKIKGKNICRIVSLTFLGILTFFQGSINKIMLIFFIIAIIYFSLRSFDILKLRRTNMETGEYYYL